VERVTRSRLKDHVQFTVRIVALGGRTIRFFLKYRGLQCRRGQLKGPCLRESLWLLHIPGILWDHVTMAMCFYLPGSLTDIEPEGLPGRSYPAEPRLSARWDRVLDHIESSENNPN